MTAGHRGREGFTAVEALVGVVLMALLLHAAWTVTSVHGRAGMGLIRRSEVVDAARLTGWTLRTELGNGVRGRDWVVGRDTLGLRAFRALATVCGPGSDRGQLHVWVRGIRAPDPSKDSVLVLWPDGSWRAHALGRRQAGPPCGDGEPGELWTLEPPAAGGPLLRVFERGSYHLADGALRYRRGRSGRQPLTAPTLSGSSAMEPTQAGVRVRLEPLLDPVEAWTWEGRVSGGGFR